MFPHKFMTMKSYVVAGLEAFPNLIEMAQGSLSRLLRFLLLCCCSLCPTVFAQEALVSAGDDTGQISRHDTGVSEKQGQGVSDPEMQEAIDHAQSTLDAFLAFAANPEEGMSGFKLKVVLKDGQDAETFWVMPFKRIDEAGQEEFEGSLANTPEVLKNVQLGQVVRFTRKEVVDWGFVNRGRQIGSFTACVMFNRIPKQQADYFREHNGFDC